MFSKDKQELVTEQVGDIVPVDYVALAIERGADLATIEKFMDLKERQDATEAKKAYVVSMGNFRADCPTIIKTKKGHNSKYAGLANTIEQIKDLLAGCGLSHTWKTIQENGLITVSCCVTHILGHQECTSLTSAPETSGNKNEIQAIGSAVEYLKRYTFFAILGLSSEDEDNDGNNRVSFEQAEELEKLTKEAGVDLPKFLAYFKCGSINQMPAKEYKNAVAAIKAKTKKGEK